MSEEKPKHIGTKFLSMFIGLVLAVIYTIMKFFMNNFSLGFSEMANIAGVFAFFVIVIPAIVFIAELLWRYVHKYSELI